MSFSFFVLIVLYCQWFSSLYVLKCSAVLSVCLLYIPVCLHMVYRPHIARSLPVISHIYINNTRRNSCFAPSAHMQETCLVAAPGIYYITSQHQRQSAKLVVMPVKRRKIAYIYTDSIDSTQTLRVYSTYIYIEVYIAWDTLVS